MLLSSCSDNPPQPRIMPPSELTVKLPPPPPYTAKTVNGLIKDDQGRIKLLGVCVIENNTKADFIKAYK